MPANWITFKTNMKLKIGMPNQLSISDLAELHATEYANAVNSASLALTGSSVNTGVNKNVIKLAFESVFNSLYRESVEIIPNYKNDKPTVDEKIYRDRLEKFFLPIAISIVREWVTETFIPTVVPTGYVSPTSGYQVLFPGDPINLAKDLAKAFFVAQEELNQEVAYELFITNLIKAYSEHLLTISGIFNGLIPSAPSPIPGPPFPWVGVI
jgi:hypothetical protein